jgi:hypothetical protein
LREAFVGDPGPRGDFAREALPGQIAVRYRAALGIY